MQKLRLLILAFLACLVTMPHAHAAPFASPNGYAVTPAPGWSVNHTGIMGTDVIVFTRAAGGFAPNLNVVITPAQPGQTLEQGRAQVAQMYPRMFTQFHMVKTGYEPLGSVRALLIAGTYTQGVNHLSMRQDIVLQNGKVYTFTCTSPVAMQARCAPAFTQMLHSVRWSR